MHRMMKNLGVYLILVVLVVSVVNMFLTPPSPTPQIPEIPYSQFRSDMAAGKIKNFTISDTKVQGHYVDGSSFPATSLVLRTLPIQPRRRVSR